MNLATYLAARLATSGAAVLGRPLPPVRFGHVEVLARVRSPFAALVTGEAYREPGLGDLLLALDVLHHAPWHLPSARRLWWLKLRHHRLPEAERLAASAALAKHVNAALGLPRYWTSTEATADSGVPWLLSLAVCQRMHLRVTDAELVNKPVALVIQECFAVWADLERLKLVSDADLAARERSRQLQARIRRGEVPEAEAIFARLEKANAGRN